MSFFLFLSKLCTYERAREAVFTLKDLVSLWWQEKIFNIFNSAVSSVDSGISKIISCTFFRIPYAKRNSFYFLTFRRPGF